MEKSRAGRVTGVAGTRPSAAGAGAGLTGKEAQESGAQALKGLGTTVRILGFLCEMGTHCDGFEQHRGTLGLTF